MKKVALPLIFAIGLLALLWVAAGFVGSSWLALAMTTVIAGVYLAGALEIRRFRGATDSLSTALSTLTQPPATLDDWLAQLHPSLHHSVRLRVEGERAALPGLALTPYLVGLLVMLGMLGTFLGMVVTFKGAVFALEGSTDLQTIRGALAAPLKGLGLSFGTSVAGVAASAMLGLMSALCRRERLDAVRVLDARIATVLRPFSLAHQRHETFRALQQQADALPQVVDQLGAFMAQVEQRNQQLNAQLSEQQQQFHREVSMAYTHLAQSVEASLQSSLANSARLTGDSLRPVVEDAMARIAQESRQLHAQAIDAAQAQVEGLSQRFAATAASVEQAWAAAVQNQTGTQAQLIAGLEQNHARLVVGLEQTQTRLLAGLEQALSGFAGTFEQRSAALLAGVHEAAAKAQAELAQADQARQQAWSEALASTTATLGSQWQGAATQAQAQQLAVVEALEKTAREITGQAHQDADRTTQQLARLLAQSEALVRSRIETEARWSAQHDQRMDQLAALWRTELAALRDDESARGQAAVARLAELQTALSVHLVELAASLRSEWQQAGDQTLAQQQALCRTLEQTAGEVSAHARDHALQTTTQIAELLTRSDELVRARVEADARWSAQNDQRMTELATLWRSELAALRDDETARGQAAVARLGELQAALAGHLATLGTALEAPMTRLMQAASEAPQAAAEVIAQLRQEMSRLTERDNLALEERTGLVRDIHTLMQSLQQVTGEQRQAIETLVASAAQVLDSAGQRFAQTVEAQAAGAGESATRMNASAIELASLGEAFQHGVQLFSSTHDKLIDSLQQMEATLRQSMTRSDEQLAYYVAQAREVIDLSISAQQGIVEDLRQLRASQAAPAAAGGAA